MVGGKALQAHLQGLSLQRESRGKQVGHDLLQARTGQGAPSIAARNEPSRRECARNPQRPGRHRSPDVVAHTSRHPDERAWWVL